MEIFRQMILIEYNSEKETAEKETRIRAVQLVLSNAGMGKMAISMINKDNDISIVHGAVQLLEAMLIRSDPDLKESLLEYLKEGGQSYTLFSYIKNELRECRERIIYKYNRKNSIISKRHSTFKIKMDSEINDNSTWSWKVDQKDLCKEFLHLLQLFCDGCYAPFQNYLREQDESKQRVSVDLISELGHFLTNLQDVEDIKSKLESSQDQDKEAASVTLQCLETLKEACQGPCKENQAILGEGERVYRFLNWLLNCKNESLESDSQYSHIFSKAIEFLHSLLEGNLNPEVSRCMIEELDLYSLMKKSTYIFNRHVKTKERMVYQEGKGKALWWLKMFERTKDDKFADHQVIIKMGFSISTLFLTLQDRFPNSYKFTLKYLSGKNQHELDETSLIQGAAFLNDTETESDQLRDAIYSQVKSLWVRIRIQIFSRGSIKIRPEKAHNFQESHSFYAGNVSSVEIQNKTEITKLFFMIPAVCHYMTGKTRQDMIEKTNQNSHQEKVEDFYNKSKRYQVEMEHQQKLDRYQIIEIIISRWRTYNSICFYLVIAINVTLVFTVKHEDEERTGPWYYAGDESTTDFLRFLSCLHVFFAFLALITYLIEYYPVIIYTNFIEWKRNAKVSLKDYQLNRIEGTVLLKEILGRSRDLNSRFLLPQYIISIFWDFQASYSSIYMIISYFALEWYMLYSILLLDIIKRSDDLINILKSITLNYKQLIYTMILGIIIVYLFTIIGFIYFSRFYIDDLDVSSVTTYCGSLRECFISNLVTGVRYGGGIGFALEQVAKGDSDYWNRLLFDMAFFIIVPIILLNVIFGIIIDTFAELRDERAAKIEDMMENCFICGKNKFTFEINRISWNKHIQMEHNAYSYLAFLVYINSKELKDCNGAEKYVKEMIEKKEVSFFPSTSLSLIEREVEGKENTEQTDAEILNQALSNIQVELINMIATTKLKKE